MKKMIAGLLLLLSCLSGPASAQNHIDRYDATGLGVVNYSLESGGSYYGQLCNSSLASSWSLGYGSTQATCGESVITWSPTQIIFGVPGSVYASTMTLSSGNFSIPGTFSASNINCNTITYTSLSLSGTLGVTGASTLGSVNAGAITGTSASVTGTGGAVSISTSPTSGISLCMAGAFDALPTTGYNEGCIAYLRGSSHTAYISTQTVVGLQSWKNLW